MAYGNRPDVVDPVIANRVVDYHDRVRWGPIISGLVVALATQLVLSSLGAAIGLSGLANSGAPRTNAGDVASGIGIWSIISLFVGLFVGGWVTGRASGPLTRNTALLNGAILWATTLALGSWLLASGVAGTFGVAASNAGVVVTQVEPGVANLPNRAPTITAQQARDIAGSAARAGWSFLFGSLLGLVAAAIGSSIGARNHNHNRNYS